MCPICTLRCTSANTEGHAIVEGLGAVYYYDKTLDGPLIELFYVECGDCRTELTMHGTTNVHSYIYLIGEDNINP
jgi:hypothetical protein